MEPSSVTGGRLFDTRVVSGRSPPTPRDVRARGPPPSERGCGEGRAFPPRPLVCAHDRDAEDASETDRGGAEDHSRGERRPGGADSVADLGQGRGRAGRRGERRREQRRGRPVREEDGPGALGAGGVDHLDDDARLGQERSRLGGLGRRSRAWMRATRSPPRYLSHASPAPLL
eukprot:scaffold38719_cov62-Phaeocystis_antarctica.AAC.2